jgi:hypothetical protein
VSAPELLKDALLVRIFPPPSGDGSGFFYEHAVLRSVDFSSPRKASGVSWYRHCG